MSAAWSSAIGRLRRRAAGSGALRGLGRVVRPGALVAVAYLLLGEVTPWARYFAPLVGVVFGFVCLVALLLGAVAARRSDLYFAKWIDMTSGLEDRLASAVEWSALKERGPFQERCIELLGLELGAHRLPPIVLPRTRPPRLLFTFAAALVVAGVAVLEGRKPPAVLEHDARQKVELPQAVTQAADKEMAQLATQAHALADPELERAVTDLGGLLKEVSAGRIDRQEALAQLEKQRERIAAHRPSRGALDDASASGPLGGLSRALARGDTAGAGEAAHALARALGDGDLSDEEAAAVAQAISSLADLAQAKSPALSGELRKVSAAIAQGDVAAAGRALDGAAGKLDELKPELAAESTVRRADQMAALLERATRDPDDAASTLAQPNPSGNRIGAAPPGERGSSDRGAQAAAQHEKGAQPPESQGKNDLNIAGNWSGKVWRQLYESAPSASASDELKTVFAEHRRVVEDRFRHDEVPEEYAEAVRIYFEQLNQRGSAWTQIKK
jgi:hypothetical protein